MRLEARSRLLAGIKVLNHKQVRSLIFNSDAKTVKSLMNTKGYAFHRTRVSNLASTSAHGLVPRDTLWTPKPAVYVGMSFAEVSGYVQKDGATLRVRLDASGKRVDGQEVFYSYKTIPADRIEFLSASGWTPIKDLS